MKILLFGITDFTSYLLSKLIKADHEVCGLVFNRSRNPDIREMQAVAGSKKIPWWEIGDLKDPKFIAEVRESVRPDLILVATFEQLLPKELYSLARIAAINMHPSYLPDYRGFHPYFWPIANGEPFTGVTFHYLSEKFDEGEIIAQEKVPIGPEETAGIVVEKQKTAAWELLKEILEKIKATGEAPPAAPQPAGQFAKAPKVTIRDFFINWGWPTRKILDRIRALNPNSPAFTVYKQDTLGVYKAADAARGSKEPPGTIFHLAENGPVVKTGDGALLLEIVIYGKKYLLSGGDFVKHENVAPGEQLGG
ncbi:MAG: methionyl-tRNA formyltransferase [Candidatus Margulisbacteria bacterium]|nr:methionyl-tRNA formyltransferase [Candidatus Margulisiibacteriota bacterium]